MSEEAMTLIKALHHLAEVHTGDDDRVGFVVHMGASPSYGHRTSEHEYIEAWKRVRMELHMNVTPDKLRKEQGK